MPSPRAPCARPRARDRPGASARRAPRAPRRARPRTPATTARRRPRRSRRASRARFRGRSARPCAATASADARPRARRRRRTPRARAPRCRARSVDIPKHEPHPAQPTDRPRAPVTARAPRRGLTRLRHRPAARAATQELLKQLLERLEAAGRPEFDLLAPGAHVRGQRSAQPFELPQLATLLAERPLGLPRARAVELRPLGHLTAKYARALALDRAQRLVEGLIGRSPAPALRLPAEIVEPGLLRPVPLTEKAHVQLARTGERVGGEGLAAVLRVALGLERLRRVAAAQAESERALGEPSHVLARARRGHDLVGPRLHVEAVADRLLLADRLERIGDECGGRGGAPGRPPRAPPPRPGAPAGAPSGVLPPPPPSPGGGPADDPASRPPSDR